MKKNKKTNKLGLPIHVGPKTKALMRKRILAVSKIVETGKSLSNRKLSKADVAYARKHLSAYKWQLSILGKAKKSTRKSA